MASHELAGIIGIIAIWTTLGAFFLGYFVAKRQSKKHVEKLAKKIVESKSNNMEKENSESTKHKAKKFDWI
jgi:uncharacterized protein YneF (UPF0154 family)